MAVLQAGDYGVGVVPPQASYQRRTAVKYYAGLDVSLKETSICIVNDEREVIKEGKALSEAAAIGVFLRVTGLPFALVGLEVGPLAPALYHALRAQGLPAVCIDARHMKAATAAMPVKTDRIDARTIALALEAGWYRPVHVKSLETHKLRTLLRSRQMLVRQRVDLDNHLRGTLKAFGLKLGKVSGACLDSRVRELVADDEALAWIAGELLALRRELLRRLDVLDRRVGVAAREDAVCRRLMTVPGVGPVTALAFRTAVEDPGRFTKSSLVGAYFGLTPRKYASGETDRTGHITKCGDPMLRALLCEAANVLLTRVQRWSRLKRWAVEVAKRRGHKRAQVALARRLAVIMHRMWLDGTEFRWRREESSAPAA